MLLNISHRWSELFLNNDLQVATVGEGWLEGQLYQGMELTEAIGRRSLSLNYESGYERIIPENGHFALIIKKNDTIFASVDKVRSIPLFYGYNNKQFYISDNARWVREGLGDEIPDPFASREFRYAGFVTGRDTLFTRVKQLQAGECLWVLNRAHGLEVRLCRYYTYIGKDFFKNSIDELIPILDKTFIQAFERLIQSANGRTLVIPLSAGLDSRLVIAMLKRLGYEKVITFSYGKEGNKESVKSQEIAARIGYPWLFVRYTRQLWKDWYRSNEFRSYSRYSDGLCSLPHIQDWPSVWSLKEQHLIPDDAIFVPGHTGDFIAGGHIPFYYLRAGQMDKNKLIDSIIEKHYRLWNLKREPENLIDKIKDRIQSRLPNVHIRNAKEAGYVIEYFDWQERQPKHVLNSLRVYEFWGYDWRIPLWDTEIMQFWQKVPFELKIGKLLYKHYLEQRNFYGAFSGLLTDGKRWKLALKKYALIERISNFYHNSAYSKLQLYRKRYLDYFLHEHQYLGIYSYAYVALKNGFSQNIYSFLVDSYLSNIDEMLKNNTSADYDTYHKS